MGRIADAVRRALRQAVIELNWTPAALAHDADVDTQTATVILRGGPATGENHRMVLIAVVSGIANLYLFEPAVNVNEAPIDALEQELLSILGETPIDCGAASLPDSATGLVPKHRLAPEGRMRLSADLFRVAVAPTP